MVKVNIFTDENNVIHGWIASPLDESLPIVEVDDPETIHVGFDKLIDGEIIADDEAYNKALDHADKFGRIIGLKKQLADTDYIIVKHLEGLVTEEEFEKAKADRQSWREEINRLEAELNA